MGTKASVSGQRELQQALKGVARDTEEGASRGAAMTADAIAEDWRGDAPVDTGEYRDSITHDDESAFSNDPKAPFVEFGTSTHVAQPAATGAAERGRKRMPDQIAKSIKAELP